MRQGCQLSEALTAAHCGLKTLAISLISNMAAGVNNNQVDGEEVDYVAAQSARSSKISEQHFGAYGITGG